MKLRKYLPLVLVLLLCLVPQTIFGANHVARMGQKGQKVEEVQAMLQQMKLYSGQVDGEFGSQTLLAVKKFQKKNGQIQDGVVSNRLYRLLSAKSGLDFAKYRKSWVMESSGYSSQDPGCNGRTATGMPLKRGIVAVDPYLIPLGTQVYVMGYGKAIAQDVGGAIKGNKIDLAFNSRGEALRWGRRRARVYIL